MDFTKIIEEVKSGIVHLLFLDSSGKKIGSGSGFLVSQKLVTCDHVITQPYPSDTKVYIRFEDSSKNDLSIGINELRRKIEVESPESENDYCLLNIPEIDYKNRYNFDLEKNNEEAKTGIEILFMGYPFDHSNLVSHRGYISSIFERNGIQVIQLDASINASNSGGPLIHPYTKKVLGIITRKETSLGEDFNKLINDLDQNIQILSKPSVVTMALEGIDIKRALLSTQVQLRIVARNMKRSSNAGIGFAFNLSTLIPRLK